VVLDRKPPQQVTKQLEVYAAHKYNSCPRERDRLLRNKNSIIIKYEVTTKKAAKNTTRCHKNIHHHLFKHDDEEVGKKGERSNKKGRISERQHSICGR
jgi:hypothetical protein